MGIYIVWLDRTRARIFKFSEPSSFPEDVPAQGRMGDEFYREVARKLNEAPRIALLGPGMAKHHLRYCLMEHYPMLYKRIAAFETMELLNDERIATFAQALDPIYLR